jgi:hypothetical protein
MRVSRSDRLIKALTALTSVAYFGILAGTALVLVGLPILKALGVAGFHYGLDLPLTAPTVQTTVQTIWGPAPLVLDDVRGQLRLPISTMPWSLLALLWGYAAIAGALMLLFLHNLRRIFQRVRDGAAFDAQNAARLRTLGAVLLVMVGLNAIAELATAIAVRPGVAAGGSVTIPGGLNIDLEIAVVGLILVALAEVFRRGAALEHEQSLVV